MRPRLIALALLVASLGLAVASCGGDGEGGNGAAAGPTTTADTGTEAETATETQTATDGGGEATELKLAADPGGALEFDKQELTAPAGPIVIELENEAEIPHNVSVEGQTSETISGGGSTKLELNLDPGEYDFICAVPGHAEAGMTGTLVVE